MKKFRSMLTISMIILVAVTSLLSILFAILTVNGRFLEREEMQHVMFGLAAGDLMLIILLAIILTIGFILVTRSMMRPIVDLERAINRIKAGDYNVKVKVSNRSAEMQELIENFNLMVEQLKGNEYLHKDFSSNISHEFKTPLAIIKGYADLLEEGNLSEEEQKNYAKHISRESKRLSALTANLLKISSLDNDKGLGKTTVFSLDEQIRQTVLSMETKWVEKNINVSLDLQDISVSGEEELLNQVWFNLLDNAIKFTEPRGSIEIVANKTGDEIVVDISDTGIGMDDETLKNIYKQFYRGNTDKRYEGNGLGLSLVYRIVNIHGGTIEAESLPGTGTCFTITLPSGTHK